MLDEALRSQGRGCAALGSPFMGRLMPLLADHWPTGGVMDAICAGFDGDLGSSGHSLPLRMAGGLHALVLTGQDAALAAVYPPAQPSDDALIGEVLTAFRSIATLFHRTAAICSGPMRTRNTQLEKTDKPKLERPNRQEEHQEKVRMRSPHVLRKPCARSDLL